MYCWSVEAGVCEVGNPCCTQDLYKVRGEGN